ncbi:non-ribosomal peptide synthetase [Calothrix sp. PCC 6303]|uniref:non-ribosomal peptide synthetase n=1 Tax=Calothrix sp. PCC 6303 TaxID=1170562 RepID=UPI0002A0585A|nr:non-ribosomal peptide synthetase [Calothrix sp. PCC 6303]AFZ01575.1 amino acid adenylation domain protein [Calothrix sp. PCC 6303]
MNQYSHSFKQASDAFSVRGYTNNGLDVQDYSTVVELLSFRSFTQPNQTAFTYLLDGETEQLKLTYQELDRLARRVAAKLQELDLTGQRALLLYPAGLDFLIAFFGCLYAGVVAVTAYPPRNQRNTPRIQAISADAQAAIALTTTEILSTVQSLMTEKTELQSLQWLTTDNLTEGLEDCWQKPNINTNTLAFLQYTSGSTGIPKGVMISHGNLLHNAQTTYQFMEHSPESKFVTWLPMYHDMGLIGGILQPLYGGFPCLIMPPASFLQRPYRWLQAISRYQGTTSGGPNFAYDLCVQKITPEQKATLDLSSWSVAFNGAEPIRHDTLERFAEAFSQCGFRREAFYPCYGMAETTLMISGVQKATSPQVKSVLRSALESNRVVKSSVTGGNEDPHHFVSCGRIIPGQKVIIINPETLKSCEADEIGEIWVSGLSVGQGYWNRQEETADTFDAYVSDTREGPFLRTGDLGFLQDEELFITGRAKDLIIIRGRNLYPQDIELTAERSHSSLRPGASAAFTVEVSDEEKLVIVQELEFRARPNIEEVVNAIRQAVTEEHEVLVYAVVLIKPGSIPKTSSGKIQRCTTCTQFENGELNIVSSNILKNKNTTSKSTQLQGSQLLSLSPKECQALLESYLIEQQGRVLAIASSDIHPEEPLTSLGLDSLKVFDLKNQIETDLEVEISVTDLFSGMSTRSLVTKILDQVATKELPSPPVTHHRNNPPTLTYPLSFTQQGLWFIHQLTPNAPTYNIPIIINLKGNLNLPALQESLNEIIRRHEVLRTSFTVINQQPVQVINQPVPLTLNVEKVQTLAQQQPDSLIQHLTSEFAQQPFDLSVSLPLRTKICQINDKNYYLIVTLHHIIADGWSIGVLLKELATLYDAFSSGQQPLLPELPNQYRDFVNWQQQSLDNECIQPLLSYWREKLQGDLPVLDLPTDRPRQAVQTFKGAQAKLLLDPNLVKQLNRLSRQQGVTLFMTLLTAFKILLHKYTDQTDILVGSPIAGRNRAEVKALIGLFINILVLRTDLSGDPSFQDLLAQVKSTALEAYVHQDLPLEKLVEDLKPNRDLSYHPLFQVMFVLQSVPKPNLSLSNRSLSYGEGHNGTSKFDLTLFMEEDSEQGLVATCEYNTDLFNTDTITRMLGHYQTLLESIVSQPEQNISQLQILTQPEVQQLLIDWNNTKKDYPHAKCIHQLFEEQVEKTPDAVAVIFENQKLTYQELNTQANQLGNYLQQQGVKPDTVVGIYMERSLSMVVALIAVLKAGGAYLPLDPSYPHERLAFMLADAQVQVVLTQSQLGKELPYQEQLQFVKIEDLVYANCGIQNLISDVQPENLAYVIYTSGSTGKPKGVMNTHHGLCNRLLWMQDTYQLTSADRVLQKTPFSFDVSVWEFFWTLLTGAVLVVAKPGGHQEPRYLSELISQQQISVLHFVPSMLQIFLGETQHQQCKTIKHVICSGEALSWDLQQRFFQSFEAKLHNLYGPTEVSIDVTAWCCKPGNQESNHENIVPIGRPIANTQIFILDRHLKPVPLGVKGELYIGGLGLARGYLNQPQLTQEKFIPHPFTNLQNLQLDGVSTRLYKTGDLARYRPDGNIEFLGRIDYQVKIRGNRLELGEIEALLEQHPQVQETVVVARQDIANDLRLVAYLVTSGDATLSIDELRGFLKQKLPDYMIPSAFVILEALPLTLNGKVDRRSLPTPDNLRPELTAPFQPPQSVIQQQIAQIWQEVLGVDKVGIHDNFFDLGGHSLLILQVNRQLCETFQREISVVTMFQNPTIDSLAEYFSQKQEKKPLFQEIDQRVEKKKQLLKNQRKKR